MSLQLAAQHLASKGRGPDTTLVHMAPHEVAGLQALARAQGGSLTINPDTGLAEAGFLSDLFKAALPMAAGWALGPAGFGLMSSLGAGATVGGISALASGSLSKGITAGLGAYGGSELASGLMGAGESALGGAGGSAADYAAAQAPSSAVGGMDPAQRAATAMAGNAPASATPAASYWDKMGAGVKSAFSQPKDFLQTVGGGSALKGAGVLGAAAAPFLSLTPKTEMPTMSSQNTGYIRPYQFDPRTQRYTAETPIRADQYGSRMAAGGTVETTTRMPVLTGDSSAAYNYLMGLGPNPLVDTSAPAPAPKVEEKAKEAGAADTGIAKLLPTEPVNGGTDAAREQADAWGNMTAEEQGGYLSGSPTQLAIQNAANSFFSGTYLANTPASQKAREAARIGSYLTANPPQADVQIDPSNTKGGWGKTGDVETDIGPGPGPAGDSLGDLGGLALGGDDGGGGGGLDGAGPRARGGMVGQYAMGGITALAQGGMSGLGSYSDGGRLLRGPGDGVSDDIPAHIGENMQPARLADGEFVVPARIVSELGNGSTEAGARQLYKMMERIQAGRAKTTGKNKVAVNSRAAKHLPA